MIDYKQLMKDILDKKVKLELMLDRAIKIGSQNITSESGFLEVYELSDSEKYRAILTRGDDIYYSETELCADMQQNGSCTYRYEQIYKVILNDNCKCECECK
ncbi:hypothetical protein Ccar_23080 [Clostridium carboxidivorans P7]|uniref:Uncharacterized protein n=1 Tax=Clostridium carboxidivorans P7 TaxID=536227 RepID=C6PNH6_9CLOT|nr:hypothetical protein [Clostridium carboxidivorans]AKN33544.1 hypothetical protein Ccar_23080 [Clostridium carboxidivorans P7]EET89297.1 hypothetical protein CcarbDRAFT_0343 [Clostridium carboxidivorans P7]EFG86874.1 hypothetical protein CLCAR_3831 [Clostridium carboxidivorans P7]